MDLWVRSQDKKTLMKANYFEIEQRDKNFLIMARNGDPYFDQCLGSYKTKERALELLDEIQNILNPMIVFKNCDCTKDMLDKIKEVGACVVSDNSHIEQLSTCVYEMPNE